MTNVETPWTLEDEVALLSAIEEYGLGDWAAVGRRLGRSSEQCSKHYGSVYTNSILGPRPRTLPLCRAPCAVKIPYDPAFHHHSVASAFACDSVLAPISKGRLHRGVGPSQGLVRGYNAPRGEFEQEYDNLAERLIASLMTDSMAGEDILNDPVDQELLDDLRAAVVSAYNFRLDERWRWKRIIRDHALIDQRKTFGFIHRFVDVVGKGQLSALMQCMRFLTGPQMDLLLESLKYQKELKTRISRLCNYRQVGLKKYAMVSLYESSFYKRLHQQHALKSHVISLDINSRSQKRPSAPLVLYNMPRYNELEDDEKELCSTSRIVPETYLGFKKLMIQECQRQNGLKLAQARLLFKIDVNKTRKIYDYLISKELIWKP